MKFSGDQSEMLFFLQACMKIAPQRSSIPSLEGIYLSCCENVLDLTATNLEVGIRCHLPVKTLKEGAVVLPAKLAEIIRLVNDQQVDIEIGDNFNALIKCSKVNFQLKGLDPLDFPEIPVMEMDSDWAIKTDLFKDMLKQTIFCASGDEGKAPLTGILFSIEKDRLTLTSSDSFRLSVRKGAIENISGKEMQFIVPLKILTEIIKFNFSEEKIQVKVDEKKQILFKIDNFLFFSKLLDEKYPAIERVIPNEFNTTITAGKNDLISCLQRIILISEGNNFITKIEVRDKIALFKANSEMGSVEEEVEIEKEGEDVDIFLNSRFLIEPLRYIDMEKIQLNFREANGPCVLKLYPQKDDYLYLVLPIKS